MRRLLALGAVAALLAACSSGAGDSAGSSASGPATSGAARSTATAAEAASPAATAARTFEVQVPEGYSETEPAPLVLLLHGYGSSSAEVASYLGLPSLADERGFLYVAPDGTSDGQGNHFWDATSACCNFTGTPVDDSGYLQGVIDEVKGEYAVDPARVYVVGHSNGGFMAYRMACDHADTVAAVVSLAGAADIDAAACDPSEPVSVLQVHGDADQTIAYQGGTFPGAYPGAFTTVSTWAGYDGCDTSPAPGPGAPPSLDFDETIAGVDTSVEGFPACPIGVSAELWTIAGGGHVPDLTPAFASDVVDFLYAHPKP